MITNDKNNDMPYEQVESIAAFLTNLSANQLTLTSMFSGYFLGQFLTVDEQCSIGNFFITLGQILLTLNAQNVTVHNIITPKATKKDLQDLWNQIYALIYQNRH